MIDMSVGVIGWDDESVRPTFMWVKEKIGLSGVWLFIRGIWYFHLQFAQNFICMKEKGSHITMGAKSGRLCKKLDEIREINFGYI